MKALLVENSLPKELVGVAKDTREIK